MQTWPALRYLNAAMVSAALSGSASPNTTTGEWPPSSMVVRFMPFAASAARCLPTGIGPVNAIFRTASFGSGGRHRGRGLGVDLALLLHHHLGDGIVALAHEVGGLVHDLAAVVGRGRAPQRKAALGGLQRLVEVGLAGMGQVRQRLLGRRI